MNFAVFIDFGSTYTKMVCVDLTERRVIATTRVPSTVRHDAAIGLLQCFDVARAALGGGNFDSALKLASSSAGGGLRLAVVGLTKSLSIKAGRNACFSAGAKIVYSQAGHLHDDDVEALADSKAEILLLCGGYESGNTQGLLHNAETVSRSRLAIPVIYAGNSSIARNIRSIFNSGNKECFLAENIIPSLASLNIESTTTVIRQLFISRITGMKGIGAVQKLMDAPIEPTPAAVLSAGEILSCGAASQTGLGPIMMADIGGATTDIYSYMENKNYAGAKMLGSPDPFAKRTVEGDLGLRESSASLVQEAGEKRLAEQVGLSESDLEQAIEKRTSSTEYLADDKFEKKLDHHLACAAVNIAARRHAGRISKELSNCRLMQRGKNLSEIRMVVGTGGILTNEEQAAGVLKNMTINASEAGQVLLPETAEVLVDRDYVLFAAGLLRNHDREAALSVMKKSLGLF